MGLTTGERMIQHLKEVFDALRVVNICASDRNQAPQNPGTST